MKKIQLTQNQFAIVCDCHAHLVEGYKWCAQWNSGTHSFYAVRHSTIAERLGGASSMVLMHRVISGVPKGLLTDHKNSNTLDNRCNNLRAANYSENQHNRGKSPKNTSGYKGVSWRKGEKKWIAAIRLHGKSIHLGYFSTPVEAHDAYAKAANELHGNFARTQ